jgi:murein DD-endopeptidase MepM/ murein hydrolase activator NlpD
MLLRRLIRLPFLVRLGVPLALVVVVLVLVGSARSATLYAESPFPVVPAISYLPEMVKGSIPLSSENATPVSFTFQPGDTLGGVLGELGLSAADAARLIEELARFADLRKLKPKDQYSVRFAGERVESFELLMAGKGVARAVRRGNTWKADWRLFEQTLEVRAIEGSLDGSLEASLAAAGGEPLLSLEMADVLQWDLDFTRDLRRGDRFRVLYETIYLDGRYESIGGVVALAYENGGKVLEAYRFGDNRGYYDGEGRPLRKMFLRSPLRYSRVTSRFSHRRFHPVLKRHRPHYGVDYGAPVGTPVRATGNGKVIFAGWDRGGGRTVKIRHPNNYLTAYLHLSRFAKGIRSGRRVSQSEVIGYVGSTGLSTGPHLDYRVQKNGRWIDPLSLKSLPTKPLPENELADFVAWRDMARRSLYEGKPLELEPAREERVAAASGMVESQSASSR